MHGTRPEQRGFHTLVDSQNKKEYYSENKTIVQRVRPRSGVQRKSDHSEEYRKSDHNQEDRSDHDQEYRENQTTMRST